MPVVNHRAYCPPGQLFYDHPAPDAPAPLFPATGLPVPSGWSRRQTGTSLRLSPTDDTLPDQGWQIHVTARTGDAAEVIGLVREYCLRNMLAVKFLRSPGIHHSMNGKYAPYGAGGELMTLYPTDDTALHRTLRELDALLAGRTGPYLLGDLRWREGPLYLRYGAFTHRECLDGDGTLVPAIARPDGVLVPDERSPGFQVPPWAPVPDFIARQIAARCEAGEETAFPYTVEKALHCSNSGGSYLARQHGTDRRVVLREARVLAGLDGSGADAVTRLHREAAALRHLAHLDGVPALFDTFTAWEHHFLAEEYIAGSTLQQYLALHNPMAAGGAGPDERRQYTDRILRILDQVEQIIADIHAAGLVFGDLGPHSIIIRPDGRVALVDFEACHRPKTDDPAPTIGTPGFVSAHATGYDRDRYALDCLRLSLFLPLTTLLELDPARAGQLTAAMAGYFPVPATFTARLTAALTPPGVQVRTDRAVADLFAGAALDPAGGDGRKLAAALVRAIEASATPQRADRLFPGDPTALRDGGHTLAHGAAGVLYALAATGHESDPDHHDWLFRATCRAPRPRPGLYDGLLGAAHCLHLLGRTDQALSVLDRAVELCDGPLTVGLYDGLAGIGLGLRHFARSLDEPRLHTRVQEIAERLARAVGATTASPAGRAGLMHGWSGPALFFLRLYDDSADPGHLQRAGRALRLDLDHCTAGGDALQLNDGRHLLPYLGTGSLGIAVALADYLRYRPDEALAATLDALHAAADVGFTPQSGLLAGRAGLAAALGHNRAARRDPRLAPALSGHLRDLAWYALEYADGIALTGDQNLRLSMDLTTGTAGLLHTLGTLAGRLPVLPLLEPGSPPGSGRCERAPQAARQRPAAPR